MTIIIIHRIPVLGAIRMIIIILLILRICPLGFLQPAWIVTIKMAGALRILIMIINISQSIQVPIAEFGVNALIVILIQLIIIYSHVLIVMSTIKLKQTATIMR
jgi:hypothetical protein